MTVTKPIDPDIGRPAPTELSYTVLAPKPPDDITADQVHAYLADHPDVQTVVISIGWLRSQVLVAPWFDVQAEIQDRGGEFHFASGVSLWEAWFAFRPANQDGAGGVTGQIPATSTPMPGVTPYPPITTLDVEPEPVLHVDDEEQIEEVLSEVPEDFEPVVNELAEQLTPLILEQRIRELAQDKGLGYRKIAAALQAEGFHVSHMKVARVLKAS